MREGGIKEDRKERNGKGRRECDKEESKCGDEQEIMKISADSKWVGEEREGASLKNVVEGKRRGQL